MLQKDNYRRYSSGIIKVYGNSAEIKETVFSLTPYQRKLYAREELTERRIAVNEQEEKAFQEYVSIFGLPDDKTTKKKEKKKPEPPIRKKGDIRTFSQRSRTRLLKRYNRVNPDRAVKPYHIVLTYPKRFPTDSTDYKTDLDVFFKRLKTAFGELEFLWKLEFQKRGAPHYHIVLYLSKNYDIFYLRNWIGKNWYEVSQRFWETKLENHLRAGTSCDLVTDLKKASFYLSKYISKQEAFEAENQGRFWGCSRNWGDLILDEQHLTAEQLIQFRRLVKRFLKGNLRMCKLVTKPINLIIFGHWSFFVEALKWVKKVH